MGCREQPKKEGTDEGAPVSGLTEPVCAPAYPTVNAPEAVTLFHLT